MTMRKFTAFCLVLFVVLVSLVSLGCSKKEPAAGGEEAVTQKTIRVMTWGSTEARYNYQRYFDQQYPEFAAKCKVEFLVGDTGPETCAERMRLALAANESIADINRLNYTQVPEFAYTGVLESLESIVAPLRDDMTQGFRLMTEFDGKAVAVAGSIKAKIWFYRKDIFDQAGLKVEDIKTLDDFIAAGKKLQTIDPKYMMWTMGPTNSMYQYLGVLSGTDTTFADRDGNYRLTTDPNFKKVLEAYKKLVDSGVVARMNEWTPDWEKAFADGVFVSYPNFTWLANETFLPKYAPDQKGLWHTAQWPSFIGEVGGSDAGGDVCVVPIYSSEKELAKEYLSLAYLDREGWFLNMKVGGAPVPVMKSWADDPRVTAPHNYLGGSYGLEVVKALDTFRIFGFDPAASLQTTTIVPYLDGAINGTMSIDEALRTAQSALESQVGNAWQL